MTVSYSFTSHTCAATFFQVSILLSKNEHCFFEYIGYSDVTVICGLFLCEVWQLRKNFIPVIV